MGGSHSQEPQARRGPGRDWVLEPRESSDWERVPTGEVVFLGPLLQSTQVSLQAHRQGPAGQVRNALHRTSQLETSLNNNKLTNLLT